MTDTRLSSGDLGGDNSSHNASVEKCLNPLGGVESSDTASSNSESSTCCLFRLTNYLIPYGGDLSGILNLASVTLGAGIISIPSAFRAAGILMATFYLVAVTCLTIYSIRLLARASEKTGLKSFETLAFGLFGRFGDVFCAVLMILLCFGGSVGYLIAVKNIFTVLFDRDSVSDYFKSSGGIRLAVALVWLVCMFPLVFPKDVNSLRYISAVGVLFIVLFVFSIVVYSCISISDHGLPENVNLAASGNAGVSGLGLFVFAYLCQVNTFKIFHEMKPTSSVNRLTIQAMVSCFTCGTMYFLCGFFGYMNFGESMVGSILLKYDPYAEPIFFVCYIGLIIKLTAAYALNMLACRTSLFATLRMDVPSMPYWKHSLISCPFAVVSLLCGLFFDDITVVFGLSGALCGGFIGFIFPALYIMYAGNWSRETVGWVSYLATYLLLIAGVVAVIFGTGDSIYATVKSD